MQKVGTILSTIILLNGISAHTWSAPQQAQTFPLNKITLASNKVQVSFAKQFGLSLSTMQMSGPSITQTWQDGQTNPVSFDFEIRPLWEVTLFDPTQPCDGVSNKTIWSPANTSFLFAYTLQKLADRKTLTMNWNNVFVNATNNFDVRIIFDLPNDSEVGSFDIKVTTRTPNYGLYKVEAPKISVQQDAKVHPSWLVTTWAGGAVMENPHSTLKLFGTNGWAVGVPSFMTAQFWALFHGNRPEGIFYFSTQDTGGYAKEFNFAQSADTLHTVFSLRNFPSNNIVVGARTYQMTYKPAIGLLPGRGGWYEAAAYYRAWLKSAGVFPEKWKTRPNMSSYVRNADLFGSFFVDPSTQTGIGNYDAINSRVMEWMNFFNDCTGQPDCNPQAVIFDQASMLIQDWHGCHPGKTTNWFMYNPPADPSVQTMLDQAPSGITYSAYFNPVRISDNDVLNSYLLAYATKDECFNLDRIPDQDGNPNTQNTYLDVSSSAVNNFLQTQVVSGLQPMGWNGVLFDSWAHKDSRVEYAGNDGHPLGGGNFNSQAIKQTVQSILAAARISDPNFYFILERLNQEMLGDADLSYEHHPGFVNTYYPYDPNTSLNLFIAPVNATIYNEYLPRTVTIATAPFIPVEDYDTAKYVWATNFQHGWFPAINNSDADDYPTHPITDPNLEQLFRFLQKIYRFYHFQEDFFKFGKRLRDLPLSGIQLIAQGSVSPLAEVRYFFPEYGDNVYPSVFSSVWQDENGRIAIALINWSEQDQNFSFILDAVKDYEMNLQAQYSLYEEKETGRQFLATFNNPIISLSQSIAKERIRVFTVE